MLQSKHRQDILEARMSRMVGVLMQACHSIGLTQIEGDGNSLLQIMDGADGDKYRLPKRQRLLENSSSVDGGERLPSQVCLAIASRWWCSVGIWEAVHTQDESGKGLHPAA